jgi:hypothetical protein
MIDDKNYADGLKPASKNLEGIHFSTSVWQFYHLDIVEYGKCGRA